MDKNTEPTKNEKHARGQSVTRPDRINITIPPWLNDQVDQYLEITRETKSGLIADLLKEHLKKPSTRKNLKDIAQGKESSISKETLEAFRLLGL